MTPASWWSGSYRRRLAIQGIAAQTFVSRRGPLPRHDISLSDKSTDPIGSGAKVDRVPISICPAHLKEIQPNAFEPRAGLFTRLILRRRSRVCVELQAGGLPGWRGASKVTEPVPCPAGQFNAPLSSLSGPKLKRAGCRDMLAPAQSSPANRHCASLLKAHQGSFISSPSTITSFHCPALP